MKKNFLLVMHLFSLVFLGFGLVKNMLKIGITAHLFIDINLFNEKRSIIGTLQSLLESRHYFPFLLIFLFGILVPIIKSVLVFYLLLANPVHSKWQYYLTVISKWAMADVFAISIFIAFLGARAMQNTSASLEPGFYFFAAYVLMSAVIVNFLTPPPQTTPSTNG